MEEKELLEKIELLERRIKKLERWAGASWAARTPVPLDPPHRDPSGFPGYPNGCGYNTPDGR